MLYAFQSPHFVLTAIPTIAHADDTGFINGEVFLVIQITRPLENNWKLLFSAQMLTSWDKFSHPTRSFQQLRAGFDIQTTQFGLAVDFDQYGDTPLTRTSPGLFVRKIFLNNK
ncbi:MAG: hypothetical protein R8N23_12155 [Reichenbachiella sp.]|uniref:hypothetical protein n=1 Tax=Reichenbachiella sp. TaxID=2184521 RepID=UPI0029665524|nr:hypothetical protein [Reichenbachiella sp.]MDW3210618.1 hypothetical protein [Reichenbachiella sp.]